MSSSEQAPAPKSVLRGHESQVHVAAFVRHNQRLATGDAEGYVVLWDLTIRRPRAVWRAHTSAILGIASWGDDKIITHGRDHRLVVWKLTHDDEAGLSIALPLDKSVPPRPEPWVLHILNVNTMNFCAFAAGPGREEVEGGLLVAVPNTLASESIDIYHLPSQIRQHTVHIPDHSKQNTGMAMALALLWRADILTLIVGYESGMTAVVQESSAGCWDVTYQSRPHSQPVLSLDTSPASDYFLTSGADALLVKHPIPEGRPLLTNNQQKSNTTLCEMPIGAENFAGSSQSIAPPEASLPSSALAGETQPTPAKSGQPLKVVTTPLKVVNTKHSGQQSLQIRSDGKIFATAGWDSKIRVYSTKTMSELAVLKWHEVGCFATAFADIGPPQVSKKSDSLGSEHGTDITAPNSALSVKERRVRHARETHWLAAGSKDGKVSLWDIY